MKKFLAVSSLLLLAACATVPVTGRRSLILVPDAEVNALALTSYTELMQKSKLSTDAAQVEMIRRVGKRIAAVSNQPDFKWEFNLIDDPKTVNAFCMPGGKVAFYTGILPICKNEDGVAAVMGHEVAHAIAKHGSERMSQQLLLNFGAMSLGTALQSKPETTKALANLAFGVGANLGFVLPHGRKQESEADQIGIMYAAKAGYNPEEAISLWLRMDEHSKGQQPPEFLSTHPSHETRVRDLEKWMPDALKAYEEARGR